MVTKTLFSAKKITKKSKKEICVRWNRSGCDVVLCGGDFEA